MDSTFGQHFDQGVYVDYFKSANAFSFNKQTIGPNALLTILERDLGLSGAFLSQLERRVKYREIIAHYLATNPDVPVKQSFGVDPEGVTSELLMFRDQLILAGWSQKIKGISTMIDLLANLEEQAEVPAGTEDRWMAVLRTLQNIKQVRFCIEVIQMHDDVEDMHPFFGNCLRNCETMEFRLSAVKKITTPIAAIT